MFAIFDVNSNENELRLKSTVFLDHFTCNLIKSLINNNTQQIQVYSYFYLCLHLSYPIFCFFIFLVGIKIPNPICLYLQHRTRIVNFNTVLYAQSLRMRSFFFLYIFFISAHVYHYCMHKIIFRTVFSYFLLLLTISLPFFMYIEHGLVRISRERETV